MGLTTAVIVSLFTDRRAEDDDVLPDSANGDKRGWWGDLVSPEVEGDRIGSRLWLLEREKTTPETLIRAREYIEQALEWLVDDGVAAKVEIEVERTGAVETPILAFRARIFRSDGTVTAYKFDSLWEGQFNGL
ncbi:MAG: hypothetical protein C4575_09340 [Desulforudis sp.]|nr:MAG: hypothetical protein C4575_09340 [Desulforudis sp.]